MVDVAPEILENIQEDFKKKFFSNAKLKKIYEKIELEEATYMEANELSIIVGELLRDSIKLYLTEEALPEGKLYYNIADKVLRPVLVNNYNLVGDACKEIQGSMNANAGIGLKGLKAPINEERVHAIIDRASNAESFVKASVLLDEPIINYTQSVVDECAKANNDFLYKAGLNPTIKRIATGKCCEWCSNLAGSYKYEEAPKDVYKRHKFCRCFVLSNVDGTIKNVHTHKEVNSKQDIQDQLEYLKKRDREKLEKARQQKQAEKAKLKANK